MKATERPLLSVVVEMETSKLAPSRQVQDNLAEVLRQAAELPEPGAEVLVVTPRAWVSCPAACTQIVAPGESYYALKSRGMRHARGEVVAFLDADCRIAPGYLARAAAAFAADPELRCVAGVTRYAGRGFLSRLNTTLSFGYLHAPGATTPEPYAALSHNLVVRAGSVPDPAFGPARGRVTGDRYLTDHYRAAGHPPRLLRELAVAHEDPSFSLPLLLERHLREHLKHVAAAGQLRPWTPVGRRALRAALASPARRWRKVRRYGPAVGLRPAEAAVAPLVLGLYALLDVAAVTILLLVRPLGARWLHYQNAPACDTTATA